MAQARGYSFTNQMRNAYGRDGVNAEYKRFSEEYFSGQDVRIYLGKTWVDEIVALNFTLQENAAPIFGYASYIYDKMAVGSRQIQGSFRINFKESYYLHSITNRLDSELAGVTSANSNYVGNDVYMAPAYEITPEHLSSAIGGDDFEKLALDFERSLWGTGAADVQNGEMNARTLNRRQSSFFAAEDARSNVAKHGFNIVVLYGPYTQTYDPAMPNESVATTAHTITGVYLTGVSQVVDGSGQPIYEDYSFIARDLDANVNVYNTEPNYKFGKIVK